MRIHWLYSFAVFWIFSAAQAPAQNPDYTDLNLSPQQQQAMANLDRDWHVQHRALHFNLSDEQDKLLRLIANRNSKAEDILAGQAKVASLKNQLRVLSTTYFLRKRNMLSEDQQRRFDGIVRERLATRKDVQM